jgi:hypothetical protein
MVDYSLITIVPRNPAFGTADLGEFIGALPGTVEWIPVARRDGQATTSPHLGAVANLVSQTRETVSVSAGDEDAVAAGWRLAQGRTLIVSSLGQFGTTERIHSLLEKLKRFDAAFAKRSRSAIGRQWQRLSRMPRVLSGTLELHDADTTCWVARIEALQDIPPSATSVSRLPRLVAANGFRVGEFRFWNAPYVERPRAA